jgi:hypothetical protein
MPRGASFLKVMSRIWGRIAKCWRGLPVNGSSSPLAAKKKKVFCPCLAQSIHQMMHSTYTFRRQRRTGKAAQISRIRASVILTDISFCFRFDFCSYSSSAAWQNVMPYVTFVTTFFSTLTIMARPMCLPAREVSFFQLPDRPQPCF